MKYVFLLSSKAGAGSFSELEHSIVKCYESNNLKYKIIKTEYKNHASEIVRKYRDCSDVLLYVCSGDGTLNEVVNAMKQTAAKFSVGLIHREQRMISRRISIIQASKSKTQSSPLLTISI